MPARVEDAHLPCTASACQRLPSQSGLGARCQFWYAFCDVVVLLVYAHGASPWRHGDAPSLRGRWLCLLRIKVNS